MISANIFASALALGAVVCAALAWITSLRLKLALESWRSTSESSSMRLRSNVAAALQKMQTLARELEAKTPEKLAAEVAELSEAVAKLADTQRRFQGRFYATLKQRDVIEGEIERVETPDEVRARLRREHGVGTMSRPNGKATQGE